MYSDQEAIYMLCRLPTTGLCHQARSLSVDPDRPSFQRSEKVVLVLRTRGRIRRLCLFTISNRRSRPMSRQNSLTQPVLHLSDSECRKILSYRANAFQDAVFVNGILERPFEKGIPRLFSHPKQPARLADTQVTGYAQAHGYLVVDFLTAQALQASCIRR